MRAGKVLDNGNISLREKENSTTGKHFIIVVIDSFSAC